MLQAQNMAPKEQTAFRADPALLACVDAVADETRAAHPGLEVSRTDAIVMLLTEALKARGIEVRTSPAEKRAESPKASAKKGAKRARKP